MRIALCKAWASAIPGQETSMGAGVVTRGMLKLSGTIAGGGMMSVTQILIVTAHRPGQAIG